MDTLRNNTYWFEELERYGYTLLPNVFSHQAVAHMVHSLEEIFSDRIGAEASIRGDDGAIYAARNILSLWPEAADIWRVALLRCARQPFAQSNIYQADP